MTPRHITLLLSFALSMMGCVGAGTNASPDGGPKPDPSDPCTDGVDCYCDTVSSDGLLHCEDWENPLWYSTTDEPGSWIDDDGSGTYRGWGSLWTQRYGGANGACAWLDGEPASATLGVRCDLSGGGQACNAAVLMPGDEFQAPTTSNVGGPPTPPAGARPPNYACLKPVRSADEIDSENLGLTGPVTLPSGGVVASRVPQGNGASTWPQGDDTDRATAGIHGDTPFGPVTEIGVAMLVAYSSNAGDTGVWDRPWKQDQYGNGVTNDIEFWHMGNTGTGGDAQLPFRPFRFANGGGCAGALGASTVLKGNFECSSQGLRYSPSPADYSQATDWPWGTWGCVRAYQRGMGSDDLELWIRFQGPGDTEERVLIHVTGFDGRVMNNQAYATVRWNNYSNYNQEAGLATSAPTYRFQDNIHIVEGVPPTCAEIGFGNTR